MNEIISNSLRTEICIVVRRSAAFNAADLLGFRIHNQGFLYPLVRSDMLHRAVLLRPLPSVCQVVLQCIAWERAVVTFLEVNLQRGAKSFDIRCFENGL